MQVMGNGKRLGGFSPCACVPSSIARTSCSSNQRAVSSSLGSITMSSLSASPISPIIRLDGKGQGWLQMEPDVAHPDSGFLENFPPCRLFNGLTRLHEARKRRIHALGPGALPPEQHAGLMAHRNDDDRIGAREMIRAARRAMPAVARVAHFGLDPAIGAEPMVRMPMQERTRLGQDGEFALRQRSCRGEAAQIHEVILGLSRRWQTSRPLRHRRRGECIRRALAASKVCSFPSLIKVLSSLMWMCRDDGCISKPESQPSSDLWLAQRSREFPRKARVDERGTMGPDVTKW